MLDLTVVRPARIFIETPANDLDRGNAIIRLINRIARAEQGSPACRQRLCSAPDLHALPWGDLLMMRRQLLNFKVLSERKIRMV